MVQVPLFGAIHHMEELFKIQRACAKFSMPVHNDQPSLKRHHYVLNSELPGDGDRQE
jgi:hypothetical protein